MEILGHSTLAMVKRYQHVLPSLTVTAAERMDRGAEGKPEAGTGARSHSPGDAAGRARGSLHQRWIPAGRGRSKRLRPEADRQRSVRPRLRRPSVGVDVGTAPYLALLLRKRLIEVVGVRGTRARRDDLKGAVYDYVSGPFIEYIRSIMEKVVSMKTTLDREQRAKAAEWKQRESEIDGVAFDLATMYGGLRGIGAALPSVPHLELAGMEPQALPVGTIQG